MSDRLAELRRQRALVAEHLAWLDDEIEHASGRSSSPSPTLASTSARPATAIVTAALKAGVPIAQEAAPLESPAAIASADAILDEYRVAPKALQSDVRKGCLLYFAVAFVLLGLGVIGLYLAFRHT